MIELNKPQTRKTLEKKLREMVDEINEDSYMLMEYLIPTVDGCRAALQVDIESAEKFNTLDEDAVDRFIEAAGDSYDAVSVCIRPDENAKSYMLIFNGGRVTLLYDCMEADVVISGNSAALMDLLDCDSRISALDLLGRQLEIQSNDPCQAVEALGLISFPSLLKMARSGIDPSSLLSEDADSIIMAASSDLVTKLVKKWIDIQLSRS